MACKFKDASNKCIVSIISSPDICLPSQQPNKLPVVKLLYELSPVVAPPMESNDICI